MLEVRGTSTRRSPPRSELAGRGTHVLVNSLNPNRREGQKTAVFEIVEELGGVAGRVRDLPYGGGGNTSGLRARRSPSSGLATPDLLGARPSDRPTTLASAIRIGDPVHADGRARRSGATDRAP